MVHVTYLVQMFARFKALSARQQEATRFEKKTKHINIGLSEANNK